MSWSEDGSASSCGDCGDRDPVENFNAFEQALPQLLLANKGKYALVAGGRVFSVKDTFTSACHAGYDAGLGKDFLVLKIAENQGMRTALILN